MISLNANSVQRTPQKKKSSNFVGNSKGFNIFGFKNNKLFDSLQKH